MYRSADDPNVVVHSATWSSLGAARSFFESPEVAAIRRRGSGAARREWFRRLFPNRPFPCHLLP